MAERATADRVAADMKPPNYRGAIQRLRTIQPKKDRIASINGEIGGIYDTIEGFKVNKKAARIFLTMDKMEPEERADIMRSLKGLIGAAEWAGGDLVDAAEGGGGNVVAASFGRRAPAEKNENAAGEDVDVDAAMQDIDNMPSESAISDPEPVDVGEQTIEQPKKRQRIKPPSPAEARERAKEHFANGTAPPPSTAGAPETYTGDNADLAGE